MERVLIGSLSFYITLCYYIFQKEVDVMKKLVAMLMVGAIGVTCLTGCQNSQTNEVERILQYVKADDVQHLLEIYEDAYNNRIITEEQTAFGKLLYEPYVESYHNPREEEYGCYTIYSDNFEYEIIDASDDTVTVELKYINGIDIRDAIVAARTKEEFLKLVPYMEILDKEVTIHYTDGKIDYYPDDLLDCMMGGAYYGEEVFLFGEDKFEDERREKLKNFESILTSQ